MTDFEGHSAGGRVTPPQWVLVTLAAAIVVTAAAVAILALRGSNGKGSTVATGATSTTLVPTTTIGIRPGLPESTTSVTDTTLPAITAPTTTPTTTVTTAANTTTTAHATTTTTVGLAACPDAGLQSDTTTDHRTYHPGDPVTVTVKVKNISAQRCQIANPFPTPHVAPVAISAAGGGVVWQPATQINGVVALPAPQVLGPGESYGWATVLWKQDTCVAPCAEGDGAAHQQVPFGIYRAAPVNAPPGQSAEFTILPR